MILMHGDGKRDETLPSAALFVLSCTEGDDCSTKPSIGANNCHDVVIEMHTRTENKRAIGFVLSDLWDTIIMLISDVSASMDHTNPLSQVKSSVASPFCVPIASDTW